jgi:hypothetical protein
VVIYPSGLVFYGIWNVAQWFLDPVTRRKVSPQMSPAGIFEYIAPEWVPEDMGGSCTFEPDIDAMRDAPPMIHRPLMIRTGVLSPVEAPSDLGEEAAIPHSASGDADDGRCSVTSDNSSDCSFHTTRQTEAWPGTMRGWAIKEGHVVKNWKRRYFVLQSNACATVLRYYFQQDPQHSDREPFGLDLMGQLDLRDYSLEVHRRDSILHLQPPASGGKHLHMHLQDRDALEAWAEALCAHLEYRQKTDALSPPPPDTADCIIL